MEKDKNTILAYVLIFAVLIGFWYFNSPKPGEEQPAVAVQQPVSVEDAVSTTTPQNRVLEEKIQPANTTPALRNSSTENFDNYPYLQSDDLEEQDIVIDTELYRAVISSRGGIIKSWRLKKHGHPKSKRIDGEFAEEDWVELIASNASLSEFFGQEIDNRAFDAKNLSVMLPTKKGNGDTAPLLFENENQTTQITLNEDKPFETLTLSLPFADGGYLTKKFVFYNDTYDFDFSIKLDGLSEYLSQSFYQLNWNNGINPSEINFKDEMMYAKGYTLSKKDLVTEGVLDADEHPGTISGRLSWVGTTTKYFGVGIIPEFLNSDRNAIIDAVIEGRDFEIGPEVDSPWKKFSIQIKAPAYANTTVSHDYKIYLGPLDYFTLKKYDVGLEKIVNMGWKFLRPLSIGILYAFVNMHKVISNYGLVLIIFSILIKLMLFPLTKKSYSSMKKMQELQPELEKMKEKYGADQQKMSQAQMRLYKERGVNPAGGCLPMLLQMPLLFALYQVFRSTIELRGEPFFWWITDLSLPDTVMNLGFSIPLYGDQVSVLPILMCVTMIFQQRQTIKDPRQKAMVYMMPVFMLLIFNRLSSGLNLYYTLFNLFTMIQQSMIKTDDPKIETKELPQKKGVSRAPAKTNRKRGSRK